MNKLRKIFLMTFSILTLLFGSQIILFAQNVITSSDFEAGSRIFVFKPGGKFFSKKKPTSAKISKDTKTTQKKSSSKKVVAENIEPVADEDWINEQADYAIEERKLSDSEPFLSLPEGYLNSRAYYCESPQFPAAAIKAKQKEINLTTLITVGQYGGILQASAIEGDPNFRATVFNTLGGMSFRQSYFMGKPIRIEGLLYFTQNPKNTVLCRESSKDIEVPAVIDGGNLTELTKSCEMPEFPADAKVAGLSKVEAKIKVIVDEQGKVIKAEPVEGHQTFSAMAVNSALKTTFPRSIIAGTPVKVGGWLVFNQTSGNDVRCTKDKTN